MRELAEERGITILELSRLAEEDEAIDREIDGRTVHLADRGEDFVMDARLGWHFIADSLKVFLDVRPDVAAGRIYGARRGSEKENTDFETTLAAIESRAESETTRYLTYYGLDYADPSHYDLVVDTSDLSVDQVVDRILAHPSIGEVARDRR